MAEQINEPNQANEPQETGTEKKYTDADVDAIIDKKFAKWKTDQDKAIASAVAKVEEAHKLAQMTEKEKLDHEREQEREELNQLRAEKAHAAMMAEARSMLASDGLTIPEEILTLLVADNAESTSKAVKSFSAMFQTAVDEAVKAKLAGGEPKKGGQSTLTKEEILSIKDRSKRLKAIEENLDLFSNGGK